MSSNYMIFPLIALVAPIAALNAQASLEIPEVITNNQIAPLVATFLNQEPNAVTVNSIVVSLRTPKKDYRKTYANYTVPANQVVASGKQVSLPIHRTFSLPTRDFDVLLDFDVEAPVSEGLVEIAKIPTFPVTVKFQDQPIGWFSPKFLLSVATVLGFIAAFGFLIMAILRPDLLEKYIFAESTKPKQQDKRVERTRTPDAPDAWLPEKHKKKAKSS